MRRSRRIRRSNQIRFEAVKRRRFVSSVHEVVGSEGLYVISNEVFRSGGTVGWSTQAHRCAPRLSRNWSTADSSRPLRNVGSSAVVNASIVVGSSDSELRSGSWVSPGFLSDGLQGPEDRPGSRSSDQGAETAVEPGLPRTFDRLCSRRRSVFSASSSPDGPWPAFWGHWLLRRCPTVSARSCPEAASKRTEAVASWTELIRDSLAASAGLAQAIVVTASSAPIPIRPQVGALATRLTQRHDAGGSTTLLRSRG